jgi:flagellin-like protein
MRDHIRATRNGISPVIATIILVTVTITVAVSVAYWMGAMSGNYTTVEKIDISSLVVTKDQATGNYTITFSLKNTGSADATVSTIYINEKAYDDPSFTDNVFIRESSGVWLASGTLNIFVPAGASKSIMLTIQPVSGSATVAPFTAGTTLDISIHTATGKNYQQMANLT